MGNRLRWESIKGVQIVREAEGISFQGPGEDDEMKEQQRVDPELSWVVRWRETGEEPTEEELFIGDSRSKYYWINREVFVLEKGVLWRNPWTGPMRGGAREVRSGEDHHGSRRRGLVGFLHLGRCLFLV